MQDDAGVAPFLAAQRGRNTATAALVGATAVWGSTFVVTKSSLDELAPATFLAWRFGVAAVVLFMVAPRRTLALRGADVRRGVALGALLGCGFLLQTIGLHSTSAGLSGFLTGSSVVLVPLVASVAFGTHVPLWPWVGTAFSAGGLVLLTGGPNGTMTAGAFLTLVGAGCFAGHITCLSQWASPANTMGLTTLSVGVASAACIAAAVAAGGLQVPTSGTAWASVLYVALVATCIGLAVQAWAQSALSAVTAGVVMTMEPVFAAALAVTLGGEALTPTAWVGGLVVVAAMAVVEIGARGCCDVASPRVECC
ncbi:MAG TPA: DMT family transporter [Jiangellaceae bacterium]|nr:DMT family transporter [Jiangellaceae bacterium]